MATFTVVVPTVGRATLRWALESVRTQLEPGDEIIVVANSDGDYGNSARNSAVERARGSHIIFLDDDDEYLPGALTVMRGYAASHPDRVLLFMRRFELTGDAYPASVGGGVFPNVLEKLGKFGPARESILAEVRNRERHRTEDDLAEHAGDHEFMVSTLELRGDEPLRIPIAVCVTRPEKSRWKRLRYKARLRTRFAALRGR